MMRRSRTIGVCILAVILSVLLPFTALAKSYVYKNSETGYVVRVMDSENLLSAEEEAKLVEDMKPVTKYGNAAFASVHNYRSSTRSYAESHARELIGDNGVLFLIDMGRREIYIYSKGDVWRKVTNSKARSITDNVYSYASAKNYYSCASAAFKQIVDVLEGKTIPEPMKIISGILLSLLMGLIINFHFVRKTREQKNAGDQSGKTVLGRAAGRGIIMISSSEVYKRVRRGSGGGGMGGSGGGGGGGGHSF